MINGVTVNKFLKLLELKPPNSPEKEKIKDLIHKLDISFENLVELFDEDELSESKMLNRKMELIMAYIQAVLVPSKREAQMVKKSLFEDPNSKFDTVIYDHTPV